MASTGTSVGVRIGVDNYAEFKKEITQINKDIKQFNSELKEVVSTSTKEVNAIQKNAQTKEALRHSIEELNKKVEKENEIIGEIIKGRTELTKKLSEQKIGENEYQQALKLSIDEEQKHRTSLNQTQTEINNLKTELDEIPSSLKTLRDAWNETTNSMTEWGGVVKGIGDNMTKYITTPIVAGLTASVKKATDFESAFIGVQKTVGDDLNVEQYEELYDYINNLAQTRPGSFEEIAKLAQIGGQLGVHGLEELETFIKTTADMASATDYTGEEAATVMARLANIMGDNINNIGQMGSAIVHLGNNIATTEPEIGEMALRLAGAGKTIGLTTPEVLALTAALSSVGFKAQAGGSAFSQSFQKMDKQVGFYMEGMENHLDSFANIAGMTADEFAKKWKSEPMEAISAFLVGLSEVDLESESMAVILDELGLSGIRESDAWKRLASAEKEAADEGGYLAKVLDLANEAYSGEDGFNALTEEADRVADSAANNFESLRDALAGLGDSFGKEILPYLLPIVQKITEWVQGFANLDEETKKTILLVAGIVAGLGPLLSIIGSVMIFLGKLTALWPAISAALGIIGGVITGTILPAILPIVGIIGGIILAIQIITQVLEHFGISWGDVFEVVGTIITWVGEVIGWVITGAIEAIKLLWGFLVEHIANNIIGLIENFVAFIKGAWEVLKAIGEWLMKLMVSIVETLFKWIVLAMTNIDTFKQDVVNTFKNLGQSIKDTIMNLINSAWNWGKDLIGNLIDGIKSKFQALKDSITNIASAISSRLHFSEPDIGPLSDFHTYMPDMMKGLAQGIDNNLYLVENATDRLARTLDLRGQNQSYNYGGVVINLNVPQGANGQQLVDEIEQELANRTIRRKVVFG